MNSKLYAFKAFLLLLFCFYTTQSYSLNDKIYKDLEVFSRIIDILDKQYVDSIDDKELIEGAIKGMLLSLDPHTVYLPPDQYKDFQSDTVGKFGGLGIEISLKDDILTVVAPIEDTPAYKAGIQAGDKIIKINDELTKDMNLMDAVKLMRGPRGKKVKLSIWREGLSKPIDYSIVRDIIKVNPVKIEDIGDGFLYAKITNFQQNTAESLKKELKEFSKNKKQNLKGLLLDLRNNPGGLLTEAIKVSDLFLKKGVIVSTRDRDDNHDYDRARSGGDFEDLPVVVMINKGSASASEIVAGALQDNKRAKVLGTESFGKGSVQTVLELGDKSAIKMTIARYYTPKGKSIEGKGIKPDLKIGVKDYFKDYPKEDENNDTKSKKQASNDNKKSSKDKGDSQEAEKQRPEFPEYQKQKAIEFLKKKAA